MNNMDSEMQLEVIITSDNTEYRAICPSFPPCEGIGETEQIALEKLSKSITRYISKLTKKTVQSILLSDNYTDLILESNNEIQEQRRVFTVNNAALQKQKRLLLKLHSLPEMEKLSENKKQPIEFIIDSFQDNRESDFLSPPQLIENLINTIKQPRQEEGFTFGFPISFN